MTEVISFGNGKKAYIFCGIKGLVRDGERLREELERIGPDRIYVSISPEEIRGLEQFLREPFEMTLSDYEIMYGVGLSRYGEVMTPPPIYIEAMQYAGRKNVPIIGLDMNEEDFTQLYTDIIKPRDILMHSLRKKSIIRRKFPYDNPEDFVIAWDRAVTKNRRMRAIEDIRTESMIKTFLTDFKETDSDRAMVVMELERCGKVLDAVKLELSSS